MQYHQAGNLQQAEQLYRQILQADPRHADALHLLGVIACQVGRHDLGLEYIGQAISVNPYYGDFHRNLGVAYQELGRLDEAAACFEQTLGLKPEDAAACYKLGRVRHQQGKLDEAVAWYQQALWLRPDAEAHTSLGIAFVAQGRLTEAIACYRQALGLRPDLARTHYNLAIALHKQGSVAEAIARYQQALHLQPDFPEAHCSLGNALKDQGNRAEAIACYRQVLHLHPDFAEAHYNLGLAFYERGDMDEAVACCQQALRLRPDYAEAYNNLGIVLQLQGKLEEALRTYREALRLQPDYAGAHSNLLMGLNYDPHADPAAVFAEHCRWGQLHGQRARLPLPSDKDRNPERRLRIGYVSPDLRWHAVTRFFETVLAHHTPQQVHVVCYAEVATPDAMTARLQALAQGWRWTCGKTAAEVAEWVRADGIDILVDLAGHTANNRLDVFAHKPAPVQVTWLGYPNTTGLTTIDYRLTDSVMDPPGQPVRDTEELVRLPRCVCCFLPPDNTPDVTPLPAQRRGYVTFGSLTNLAKLNVEVFDLWCQVLQAIPTARLLMFRHTLQGKTREAIQRQFTERGIAADRLDLRQGSGAPGFLGVYEEIDVSLDVFPYSGGTTSFESLWMGVPILSLRGVRPAGRGSATALASVGLADWAVQTPQEYVALAVRVAGDLDGLAGVRGRLRDRMRATLCDAPRFTQELEDVYRTMWRRWCAETGRS
jgi:predicted O-linked N-acetylglucosamine transferase (SPINDLY family)